MVVTEQPQTCEDVNGVTETVSEANIYSEVVRSSQKYDDDDDDEDNL